MGLTFGQPWALALLPIVLWIVRLGWPRTPGGEVRGTRSSAAAGSDPRAPGAVPGTTARIGGSGTRRRVATSLRAVAVAALVLALAEPRIHWPSQVTSVAFLLDVSHSLPAEEIQRAERFIAEAGEAMAPDDLAAVVAFGSEAVVDRSSRPGPPEPVRSITGKDRTDLAAALRTGLALLPSDTNRRLVVLSDGRANAGDISAELEWAAVEGVPVDVVPLVASTSPTEVLIDALEVPAGARVGQRFDVTARVVARRAGQAALRIRGPDGTLFDESIRYQPGENTYAVRVEPAEAGPMRFDAEIVPTSDGRSENNTAAAITLVEGPPRILVTARNEQTVAPLVEALESADRNVDVVPPDQVPASLVGLSAYEAVVLADVPAVRLPGGARDALGQAVRDMGLGLVMLGGPDAFGAGGYDGTPIEKALPVEMEVRDKERRPPVSMLFVIDRSGSMSACSTCGTGMAGGPGLSGGPNKLDLAKEAVLRAAEVLRPEDSVGVIIFDDAADVLVELSPVGNLQALRRAVGGTTPGGGTNIKAGLDAGVGALDGTSGAVRHIVLLTDGWSESSGYEALLARMDQANITLSTVAVGPDSAPYLADLALEGGGRHYPVVRPAQLPQIFVEEVQKAAGTYVVEEPFEPVPGSGSRLLAGIDSDRLPTLLGYNGTTPKASAIVPLWTHLEDPLLAHWHYGLGRSAVWTSDLSSRWAPAWMDRPVFPLLAVQLVDWVLPAGQEDIGVTVEDTGGGLLLTARLTGEAPGLNVQAVVAGADHAESVTLRPTAPGLFVGDTEQLPPGSYVVTVTAAESDGLMAAPGRNAPRAELDQASQGVGSPRSVVARQTVGWVVPYSPEFASPSDHPTDPRLLAIPGATGGRVLESPETTFQSEGGARRRQDVWPWLTLLALALIPMDIGARRLGFGASDLASAWSALSRRRSGTRDAGTRDAAERAAGDEPGRQTVLDRLAAAKSRAGLDQLSVGRERDSDPEATESASADDSEARWAPTPREDDVAATAGSDAAGSDSSEDSTLARLRAAKRRARTQRGSD